MRIPHSRFKQFISALLLASSFGWVVEPARAALSIADDPLFLSVAVAPNIVMTLDDSGSMAWAFIPDSLGNQGDTKRFASSDYNPMYYNPAVTYSIPTRHDGVTYTTSFTSARRNGFDASRGTVNLSTAYKVTVVYYNDYTVNSAEGKAAAAAAYYYVYTPGANNKCDAGSEITKTNDDCYVKKTIASSEQQNFANWYSFYRTRSLATISGAMTAVNQISESSVRFAWQSINDTVFTSCRGFGTSSPGTCHGYTSTNYDNRIRTLDATHKTRFFDFLQRFSSEGGTPLRTAMIRAGDYFTRSGVNSPYAEEPQVTAGAELSCRKNFHVMMTDGIWNSDNPSIGNEDNTPQTLGDGTSYSPRAPYKDANSNSLSDIAFKYWRTDLRTGLANGVTSRYVDRSGTTSDQYWNAKNDPATWQHMVNYTVGLGLTSLLTDPDWAGDTYAGDYTALSAGTKNWPATGSDATPGNVYDLWHAALNSRGEFFSADSPDGLAASLNRVVRSILDATPSAAALAANSTSIQTGALVYQATFDSKDWSGNLIAYPVQGDGSVGSAQWEARSLMPAASARQIYTFNGSGGVAFTSCGVLSTAQQNALNTNASGVSDGKCTDRLNWLRGNSVSGMRSRTYLLGDIVNSDPVFVQAEDDGYASVSAALLPEAAGYAAFVAGKSSRMPMVYVGSNDGMLHGFRADVGAVDSGAEKLAYIPSGVFEHLGKLTAPDYAHKYYVDGGPTVGDAYLSGTWKTLLVGGLGGGGKSVYALDVSNPSAPSASMVKWEFTDPDLGLTYSKPLITRLNDGSWAAIFGNGYNSASEQAYLYIVNLETGALIRKIAAGTATANGLSSPVAHDSNGDKIVDAVYAGDLQGNLWKFDLSAIVAGSWGVANSGAPLFMARNGSGTAQPITAQPVVGGNPAGGAMVYIGTGQYLGNADVLDTTVQSFYGIWDNGTAIATTDRSELQEQSLTAETTEFGYEARASTATTVTYPAKRGWYMDFDFPSPAGERIVTQALLKYDRVIFLTVIPSTDACEPGGTSWLMELDALSGAAPAGSSFDFDNDGDFDTDDLLASGDSAAGLKTKVGITKPPAWFKGSDGKDTKVMTGTTGGIESLGNKGEPPPPPGTGGSEPRRVYWIQIQ